MGSNLRYPNINAPTEREQVVQIKNYLHQLVDDLQWELNNIDTPKASTPSSVARSQHSVSKIATVDGQATFDANVVIERGTEGNWHYRKWLDGTAECWCRRSVGVNIDTAWGSIYYGTVDKYAFPSGLFVSAPMCQITAEFGTTMQAAWTAINGRATNEYAPALFFCRPMIAEAGFDILYYAIGSWK